jgi:hypothetical protein
VGRVEQSHGEVGGRGPWWGKIEEGLGLRLGLVLLLVLLVMVLVLVLVVLGQALRLGLGWHRHWSLRTRQATQPV